MRLLFQATNGLHIGAITDGGVVDFSLSTMATGEAIKGGQLDNLATLLQALVIKFITKLSLTLALPILGPGKFYVLGNYMDHVAEGPFDKMHFQQFLCVVRPH